MAASKVLNSLRRLPFRPAVNKRGSILIITLWTLFLLSVFTVYLGYGVRQKLTLAHRLDERDKLRFIAEGGVKKAIVTLAKADLSSYASLLDRWSHNERGLKDVVVADGMFSVYYDYLDEQSGSLYKRYGLIDEEGKININKMNQQTLRRLFRIVLEFNDTQAQKLAASIVDWRDGDSALSVPIGSAEDRDYRALYYSYEAKDAEFEVLEELLLVNGMDSDIFKRIKEYVTIYGDGKVNINTASRAALLALGLNGSVVDKIFRYRSGKDEILGTDDDGIFNSHATIIPSLSQFSSLTDGELSNLSVIVDQNLVTTSHNFWIRSVARLKNKKGATEILCVVDENGKMLYWHES